MQKFLIAAALLVLAHPAHATDLNSQIASRARALESRSEQSLGIGIQQLSLLLQATPNEYFRKASMESDGTWVLLKDLEAKGFIKIVQQDHLPDGSSAMGSTVVSCVVTAKGQAVLAAIRGK